MYPFAEVSTTEENLETCLVTVLHPYAMGSAAGNIRLSRDGAVTKASISTPAHAVELTVYESGAIPAFEVH